MDAEQDRRARLLRSEDVFRRNAFTIIDKMLDWCCKTGEHTRVLVDEVLHSIFFLGQIYTPPFSPAIIILNEQILNALMTRYPRPFALYSSQLPRRSPFSCVLDMVVLKIGQENINTINNTLLELVRELNHGARSQPLLSAAICVSHIDIPKSVRYYGASMCTPRHRQIMIAASCLESWDDYVADAVMTYYPDNVKKPDFDGTIQLPDSVRCEAFNLRTRVRMLPCRTCGNLFGLNTTETRGFLAGNCAEAESVSKLLQNEAQVRGQVQPTAASWTDENRQRVRDGVLDHLNNLLRDGRFIEWDGTFYLPEN